MLVPIIGLGWTLAFDAALIAVAVAGVVVLCRWMDAPRRELIDDIKRRPVLIVTWRGD